MRRAVAQLPEEYRVPLILHHYQQMSYRQVADCLGPDGADGGHPDPPGKADVEAETATGR